MVLEDDVLVSIDSPFTVDLGPDVTTCDTPDILLDAEQENQNFTYQWFLDGTLIAGATSPTYLVTALNSGTYSVEVIDPSDPLCPGIDQIIITYLPIPIIANPPIDLFQCDNGTNTGIFDLTVNTPVVLGPQNPADFVITYHNTALDAENDLAPIAAPALYPGFTTQRGSRSVYRRFYKKYSCMQFSLQSCYVIFDWMRTTCISSARHNARRVNY